MLSLLAKVIMTLALSIGALSAATAYTVSTDLADERLLEDPPLQLAAAAGMTETASGEEKAIAEKGEALTPEVLASLRDAKVGRIRVASFQWSRWPERWWFIGSLAALAGGALMLRTASRKKIEAARLAGEAGASPAQLLGAMRTTVDGLLRDLPGLPDDAARNHAIVERIGALERNEIVSFVEARPALIAHYGLAGFAHVMDGFAAAERQLNRAWSAAADGVHHEAEASLRRAAPLLEEASERLAAAD